MGGKRMRELRVLYVTRTPNKVNPLVEHLKSIGVDVDVVDSLSGVNARKIGGKSFEYAIVDEVIDDEL